MALYCQQCGHATVEREIDGRLRPVCSSCGAVTYLDPKLAVVIVISRDRQILLGKRGGHTREPGKWSFPAGFVERGEQVEAAAQREAAEEVGLTVTLGPLLGLYSHPGETVALAAYAALDAAGDAVPGDDLTAVAWYPVDALPDLAFPHDQEILAAWHAWRECLRKKRTDQS